MDVAGVQHHLPRADTNHLQEDNIYSAFSPLLRVRLSQRVQRDVADDKYITGGSLEAAEVMTLMHEYRAQGLGGSEAERMDGWTIII